jgi:hypothetical protein
MSGASLPSLIVIGAMKSGTTTLHHYLDAHPDIFVPPIKEVNFFVAEHNWSRGIDWYRRQYRRKGDRTGADVSPDYSKHPHYRGVPERMARTVPDAAIGYVVRDPVQRIASMFRHQVAMGRERRSIDDAVLQDPHYVETSSYAMQLDQYLGVFPASQIRVLPSGRLRSDPLGALRELTDVLGLAPLTAVPAGEWNRSDEKGRPRSLTRVAQHLPYQQHIMDALPEPVRRRVRRAGHRPVDGSRIEMSPATVAELRARLRDDVARLERWAPGISDEWCF